MSARSLSPLSLRPLAAFVALVLAMTGCSSADEPAAIAENTTTTTTAGAPETTADGGAADNDGIFPDVVGVEASSEGGDSWSFAVTLSSPYDSPSRYADSWRVVGPDGTVYGERFLTHDHAGEQPFTRSQSGIEIPADVLVVTVEGRDQVNGWGGTTMEYALPR